MDCCGSRQHLVPKVLDVLNRFTDSGIVVNVGVANFFGNSLSRISSERGELETLAAESVDRLYNCSLASSIRLWITSSRALMSGDSSTLLRV